MLAPHKYSVYLNVYSYILSLWLFVYDKSYQKPLKLSFHEIYIILTSIYLYHLSIFITISISISLYSFSIAFYHFASQSLPGYLPCQMDFFFPATLIGNVQRVEQKTEGKILKFIIWFQWVWITLSLIPERKEGYIRFCPELMRNVEGQKVNDIKHCHYKVVNCYLKVSALPLFQDSRSCATWKNRSRCSC